MIRKTQWFVLIAVSVGVASCTGRGGSGPGRVRRVGVAGTVVDTAGRPVEGAVLLWHMSRGNVFDANPVYHVVRSGPDGAFSFPRPYYSDLFETDEVYCIKKGYYPRFAYPDTQGFRELLFRLQEAPQPALGIREDGVVSITASGERVGFSFSQGSAPTDGRLADLLPCGVSSPGYIETLCSGGNGGLIIYDGNLGDGGCYACVWCAFLNATVAPSEGYVRTVSAKESFYFVRCADGGHFAKIIKHSQALHPDGSVEMFFSYVYQPKSTRDLASEFAEEFFRGHALLSAEYVNVEDEDGR